MSQKLRLAFFAEILIEDFDGASRSITNILNRIPADQYDVLLICGVPPKNKTNWQLFTVPVVKIPINEDYSMAVPQLGINRLNKQLIDFNPDVIHISTPSLLGKFALSYGRKQSIPVITVYHTHFISYIDYYLSKMKFLIPVVKGWIITGQKSFYAKCDKVYIPTKAMKNELLDMGFDEHNFRIWPRGINTTIFSPEKKDINHMHSITRNTNKNILFASRLVWEKNLETLIRIYQLCTSKNLPYNFIIAGDGVASDGLKEKMPDAFFLGHQNHECLAVLYASCDVFLFTSISETFGNVVIEAQASGLPVVIANGGGSAGLVDHGINGYLCAHQDDAKYLEYITELCENEVLRGFLVQNAFESVKQYQWSSLMDIYLNDLQALKYKKEQEKNISIPFPMEFAM
ncbi:MAG: GDP-mannose-dependent alpha-mannosyltransferase [Bacteroidota bacterium]